MSAARKIARCVGAPRPRAGRVRNQIAARVNQPPRTSTLVSAARTASGVAATTMPWRSMN
jgi:hypothetical protein